MARYYRRASSPTGLDLLYVQDEGTYRMVWPDGKQRSFPGTISEHTVSTLEEISLEQYTDELSRREREQATKAPPREEPSLPKPTTGRRLLKVLGVILVLLAVFSFLAAAVGSSHLGSILFGLFFGGLGVYLYLGAARHTGKRIASVSAVFAVALVALLFVLAAVVTGFSLSGAFTFGDDQSARLEFVHEEGDVFLYAVDVTLDGVQAGSGYSDTIAGALQADLSVTVESATSKGCTLRMSYSETVIEGLDAAPVDTPDPLEVVIRLDEEGYPVGGTSSGVPETVLAFSNYLIPLESLHNLVVVSLLAVPQRGGGTVVEGASWADTIDLLSSEFASGVTASAAAGFQTSGPTQGSGLVKCLSLADNRGSFELTYDFPSLDAEMDMDLLQSVQMMGGDAETEEWLESVPERDRQMTMRTVGSFHGEGNASLDMSTGWALDSAMTCRYGFDYTLLEEAKVLEGIVSPEEFNSSLRLTCRAALARR